MENMLIYPVFGILRETLHPLCFYRTGYADKTFVLTPSSLIEEMSSLWWGKKSLHQDADDIHSSDGRAEKNETDLQ